MGQLNLLPDLSTRSRLWVGLLALILFSGKNLNAVENFPTSAAATPAFQATSGPSTIRRLPSARFVSYEYGSEQAPRVEADSPPRRAEPVARGASSQNVGQRLAPEEVQPWESVSPEGLSVSPNGLPREVGSSGVSEPLAWAPKLPSWSDADSSWNVRALARAYWLNDQRLEWTGLESTFGAEGAIAPRWHKRAGDWDLVAYGDIYLNQPFDQNILADTSERRSYLANFETQVVEISNLYLSAQYEDWTVTLGKFESPFGRYYFPRLSNPRFDAPFIRTEAINWRETGLLIHRARGWLVADVALTNGNADKDTNSSKALVARLGLQGENFAAGCSIKKQDGIGSEWQKYYQNHVGADAMVRSGNWTLSGEVIYDEYGFRRPGIRQVDITWGRSLYNRDLYNPNGKPLSSVGYYADLGYHGEQWYFGFNFGQNRPVAIGDALHDRVISRGIFKTIYSLTPGFDFFGVVMLESGGFPAQANRDRKGDLYYTGFQATF